MGKGNRKTYMVEIIMDKHRGRYGVVNINIPKDIKDQAKDFCKENGLVFTKFCSADLALREGSTDLVACTGSCGP